jgi:hypothetical protein
MMPRHRKVSGPRHRARRREGSSRRIVVPRLPPITPVFRRDATLAVTPTSRRPRLRAARSLLATPWSAAGAGIVVAAVLAVDSPTALTYGPTLPMPCRVQGCNSSASHPPGQTATATPGVALKAPGLEINGGPSGHARRAGRAAHATLIGYQIVRQWSSGFLAVITLPSAATSGAWSLSLSFATARVDQVWGARWQPSGNGDGGTLEGLMPSWGDHDPGANQIILSLTGTPQAPSGCVLDGHTCGFGREPSADDGQRPVSG